MRKDDDSKGEPSGPDRTEEEKYGPILTAFLMEVRRWRIRANEVNADYLMSILSGEHDQAVRVEWLHAGFATFESLLKFENLVDLGVYAGFKAAVRQVGFERVRSLGVRQATLLVEVPADAASREDPTKPARQAIYEDQAASVASRGMPTSPRQFKAIVQRHFEKKRVLKVKPMVDERIANLEKQNADLRRSLARVTRERDVALIKLARARERLRDATRRSRSKK